MSALAELSSARGADRLMPRFCIRSACSPCRSRRIAAPRSRRPWKPPNSLSWRRHETQHAPRGCAPAC